MQPQFVVDRAFVLVGACSGLARSPPGRPAGDVLGDSDQGPEDSVEWASDFVAGELDETVVGPSTSSISHSRHELMVAPLPPPAATTPPVASPADPLPGGATARSPRRRLLRRALRRCHRATRTPSCWSAGPLPGVGRDRGPRRTGSGGELVQYIAVPGTPLQQWAGENQMPTQWTTVSSEQQGATQLPLGSRSNQVGAKTA